MKLHLPKLLLIAVAGIMTTTVAEAAINYTTTSIKVGENEVVSKHYDVGEASNEISTVYTDSNGTFEMYNHDTMGIYTDTANKSYDTLKTHDFGKSYEGTLSGGAYTNEVTIGKKNYLSTTKYDLILNDYAVIALGGQYRKVGTFSTTDKYVGITAKNVTLNDASTLIAGRADFSSLTVNDNATVTLHGINAITQNSGATEYTGGNNMSSGRLNANDKVTKIGSIAVNDSAQVTLGVDNGQRGSNDKYKTNHWINNLNGTITQKSATAAKAVYDENGVLLQEEVKESALLIKGKTYFSAALNINQAGGLMEIGLKEQGNNDSLVYLSSSSNNQIVQTTSGTLRIGKMIKGTSSVENSQIIVTQMGAGLIELKNGVEFSTANEDRASSISQSANGTINLTGNYTSALFNLTQTGSNGTINLGTMTKEGKETSSATMNAGSLQQEAGNFVISNSSKLTANSISISGTLENFGTIEGSDSSLLEIVGGKVENNGTIYMNISMTGGELTAADGSTFADITATSGTIYLGDVLTLGTLTLGGDANIASTFALRNQQNGVTVYVGEGGAQVNKLVIQGDNVTFVAKTNGTLADITEPLTLFRNGTDYDLSKAKLVIEDSTGEKTEVAFKDNQNGTVTVTGSIPEPTTATLSLLALAALAARRRRR